MLQQTLIKVVEPRYSEFVERYPDIRSVSRASEAQMREAFRGLGYYRRFRLFHQAAQELCNSSPQDIRFPDSYEAWLEMSGVGPYVAAAISSITLDAPRAVLDGNVERVLCRLDGLEIIPNIPSSKRMLQLRAQELLDTARPGDYNQAVMELGQRICTPTKPDCMACPVREFCRSYAEEKQARCPLPKQRPEFVDVKLRLTVQLNSSSDVAIHARPESAHFLSGISGFLTEVYVADDWQLDDQKRIFNSGSPKKVLPSAPKAKASHQADHSFVGIVRHSITKHRIAAEVFVIQDKTSRSTGRLRSIPERWLLPSQVESSLLSNLDRKAWKLLIRNLPGIL